MALGTSLEGARPELLAALDALRAIADQQGVKFRIADFGGLRTAADTSLILGYRDADWAAAVRANPTLAKTTTKEKWRPIAPWGASMHNYGAAFDVVVTEAPAGWSKLAALNFLKDQSDAIGLVDGRDFGDGPHFELPGGLAAAKAAWQKMTGTSFFQSLSESTSVLSLGLIATFAVVVYFLVIRRKK
jgi:hypothetical protein